MEHGQRLQHDCRRVPPQTVGPHHRLIEDCEHGQIVVAPLNKIDAAPKPVARLAKRLLLDDNHSARLRFDHHGGTAQTPVEHAAHRQNGIANRLRLEPAQPHLPEKLVLRIGPKGPFIILARGCLAVDRGHHHPLDERLDAPAVGDEISRQPLEQFRVRGSGARLAEIFRRRDDAFPKKPPPDAVRHHPRNERFAPPARRGKPAGKRQSPAAGEGAGVGRPSAKRVRAKRLPRIIEHREHARLDPLRGCFEIAASQHERLRRRPDVKQRVDFAVRAAPLVDGLDLLLQPPPPFPLGGLHRFKNFFARNGELLAEFSHQVFLHCVAFFRRNQQRRFRVAANGLGQRRELCIQQALFVRTPQRLQAPGQRLFLLIESLIVGVDLGLHALRDIGQDALLRRSPVARVIGGSQDRRQPVVVALGNRLELVVMALRARHRQAQHVAGENFYRILQHAIAMQRDIALRSVGRVLGRAQEAGGDEHLTDLRRVAFGSAPVGKLVARDLLGQKTVVGLVVIERPDNVIAILPLTLAQRKRLGLHLAAVGVYVSGGIEPVTAPALAEMRRGQ